MRMHVRILYHLSSVTTVLFFRDDCTDAPIWLHGFFRDIHISVKTYYYWLRRLRTNVSEAASPLLVNRSGYFRHL